MAALTADIDIPHLGTPTKVTVKALSGGDTFYKGSLVFADSSAGLAQLVPASGDSFIGICAKQTVAAEDGDVEVYVDGVFAIKWDSATEADAGHAIFVDISAGTLSDNEEDLISPTTQAVAAADILIGKCIGLTTADVTRGWVLLNASSSIATAAGIGWGG